MQASSLMTAADVSRRLLRRRMVMSHERLLLFGQALISLKSETAGLALSWRGFLTKVSKFQMPAGDCLRVAISFSEIIWEACVNSQTRPGRYEPPMTISPLASARSWEATWISTWDSLANITISLRLSA